MSDSITTRCNPFQRQAFKRLYGAEPALGTLRERLDIIIANHGGRAAGTPSPMGIEDKLAYVRWGVKNAPDSLNPFTGQPFVNRQGVLFE